MKLSRNEIEQHNSRRSCWVAIHGAVYDVTGTLRMLDGRTTLTDSPDFLDSHPGGAQVILRCAGRDATGDFDSVHSPELLAEALPETAWRGQIDPAELAAPYGHSDFANGEQKSASDVPPPLRSLLNLHDFEEVAQRHLSANAWAYYSSGADDEISKRQNVRAYQKVALRPRILRNISTVDATVSILGYPSSLPVYMSPVGIAKLAHPDGECALAAAAGKEGLVQVLANSSSIPIERVVQSCVSPEQPIFQQLYVNRDISKSVDLVRRAEAAGARAIWITVDSPVVGKREMDERLNLTATVWTCFTMSKE
ncbi:hypothetical protein N7474_003582 [Penicillium riverlandense]|uniref:uncharacterized protein n=1 Tax=Penicillium riverlandense TaxID=1903569 RepID=UPI002548CD8A|nr:uncharacterized protein N7474_003582 [Penicillium riverlandense]KAJ5826444.1 hypothetical protein N7474_003582 [Penicillium riverlandense]